MVFKLVPPYFCDLSPIFVSERSSYSSVLLIISATLCSY